MLTNRGLGHLESPPSVLIPANAWQIAEGLMMVAVITLMTKRGNSLATPEENRWPMNTAGDELRTGPWYRAVA
ncbi:MAG: hypothetical protein ACMUIL_12560 [bacterium]